MKHLLEEIARCSGLRIPDASRERLEQHILTRMRALDLRQPRDFIQYLQPASPSHRRELQLLARRLTTLETFFMRDAGQMQLLRDTLLPMLMAQRGRERRLRLWSAACATGEEAYSLAILIHELRGACVGWQIAIEGTDLNPDALRRATAGRYGDWALRGCDEGFRRRYFQPGRGDWVLRQHLRGMVRFMPCDLLLDPLPDPGRGLVDLDLILCRNLFIYLQPEATDRVTHKLALCLRDGGLLLTGHGELRAYRGDLLRTAVYPQSVVYRKAAPDTAATAPASAPVPSRPAAMTPAPSRNPQDAPSTPPSRAAPTPPPAPVADPLLAAWRLADAGHLGEALAACRGLLAQAPMRPEPHFLAAVLAMESGDAAAARESLRKALYLAPDMIAAHVHLEHLQAGADQPRAANKTRAVIAGLLADLPPDARVPFLGEGRAADLSIQWARPHDRPPTPI